MIRRLTKRTELEIVNRWPNEGDIAEDATSAYLTSLLEDCSPDPDNENKLSTRAPEQLMRLLASASVFPPSARRNFQKLVHRKLLARARFDVRRHGFVSVRSVAWGSSEVHEGRAYGTYDLHSSADRNQRRAAYYFSVDEGCRSYRSRPQCVRPQTPLILTVLNRISMCS